MASSESFPKGKSDSEWRAVLNKEQFRILREKGTEMAGTGKYDKQYPGKGVFTCAACDTPLYTADTKFKSGCGWPSFCDLSLISRTHERLIIGCKPQAIPGAVTRHTDRTFGMERTEIVCTACGGHLGHVFKGEGYQTISNSDDRHCVNSVSLKFDENDDSTYESTTAAAGEGAKAKA